jgi:hypothetical protein
MTAASYRVGARRTSVVPTTSPVVIPPTHAPPSPDPPNLENVGLYELGLHFLARFTINTATVAPSIIRRRMSGIPGGT